MSSEDPISQTNIGDFGIADLGLGSFFARAADFMQPAPGRANRTGASHRLFVQLLKIGELGEPPRPVGVARVEVCDFLTEMPAELPRRMAEAARQRSA